MKAKGTADPDLADTGARALVRRARSREMDKRRLAARQTLVVRVAVSVLALIIFAFPTFLLLAVGLAPTWVAIIADARADRYRLQTIAACNLSGIVPFLVALWTKGHTLGHGLSLLGDVYTWAIMYLGAAAGVAALWIGPHFAAMAYNMQAVRQRRALEKAGQRLVDEWGTDLTITPAAGTESVPAPKT